MMRCIRIDIDTNKYILYWYCGYDITHQYWKRGRKNQQKDIRIYKTCLILQSSFFNPKNPDPSYGNTRPSKRDTPGASKQVVLTDILRILREETLSSTDFNTFQQGFRLNFERFHISSLSSEVFDLMAEVTLPETNSKSTWKRMVGIRSFPFGMDYFQGQAVSFREGSLIYNVYRKLMHHVGWVNFPKANHVFTDAHLVVFSFCAVEDVIYLGWSGWRGGNFKLWKAQIRRIFGKWCWMKRSYRIQNIYCI